MLIEKGYQGKGIIHTEKLNKTTNTSVMQKLQIKVKPDDLGRLTSPVALIMLLEKF